VKKPVSHNGGNRLLAKVSAWRAQLLAESIVSLAREPGFFVSANRKVHALDRRAGCTFAQVIQPGNGDEPLIVAEDEQLDPIGVVASLDVEEAVVEIAVRIER
jgi:hypothetical protein